MIHHVNAVLMLIAQLEQKTRWNGIREANNLALLAVTRRLSNPELCEGHQGSQTPQAF
jgi:hypothetical protein